MIYLYAEITLLRKYFAWNLIFLPTFLQWLGIQFIVLLYSGSVICQQGSWHESHLPSVVSLHNSCPSVSVSDWTKNINHRSVWNVQVHMKTEWTKINISLHSMWNSITILKKQNKCISYLVTDIIIAAGPVWGFVLTYKACFRYPQYYLLLLWGWKRKFIPESTRFKP